MPSAINCNEDSLRRYFFYTGSDKMKNITVIGGDSRLKTAAEILKGYGFNVKLSGVYGKKEAEESDVLLLPVPTTRDGTTVFSPFSKEKVFLADIARLTADRTLILACNYMFDGKNCIDYGKNDAYCLLNAIPTAEGAIKLAIENTPFTLWGSLVLVIGYGRVGKILADRLKGLGCRITVSARKSTDFALISANGYYCANTYEIGKNPDYDIIFNTVDAEVLTDGDFKNCTAKLIVDLSSKGGFNTAAAEEYGITAIKAPGLPGKTAPQTAGEILAKTVKDIILQR